ncbi:carcinoembryonic antigen-related cell adhesion molecule 1-like [Gigantopelta aegis]|uniref:carcinoembryonic antigen-related cell adhesion molecule 1-like n=1 Tax=Gigantopelta aegis TaxID=1735272 RepID=UPI001B8886FC|nr:carcinoembryonic antigen-related cell adhesion molecule 1-like [Gigantopelta aegis]
MSCGSGTNSSSSSTKNYTLEIAQIKSQDAADWSCRLFGSKMSVLYLKISSGPNNVTFNPLPPTDVKEGGSVKVNCIADCVPPCFYSWTWGKEIIRSTSLLALENIKQDKAGAYTCTATNTFLFQSDYKTFELTVLAVGTATIVCTGGAYLGQNTTIVCKITNTIVGEIRFLRPNSGTQQEVIACNRGNTGCLVQGGMTGYSYVIDSSSQTTLTIQSFNPSTDEGEWICRDGPSSIGEATCNMNLFYDPERMSALSAGAISGIVIAVVLALAIPTVWILYKRKIKKKAEDVQNESNN